MNIVCILKQVPDAEARLELRDDRIDLVGSSFVIDGMDEYGVEQALRLREAGHDAEIVALTLGPKRYEEAIRTALALGADRAVHLETGDDTDTLDPVTQATVLAQIVRDEEADLVFVGGKEADWDSAALGPALAEALGWPHSDWTTQMELSGGTLSVTHDSDEGSETLTLSLPAVVTTQQGLNEPRYPTLPNIMKSKRKPLDKRTLGDLGGATAKTRIVRQVIETRARRQDIIEGDPAEAARTLAERLHDEAKVV